MADGNPNQGVLNTQIWAPARAVPAKLSAPLSGHETHYNESSRFLWITFWTKGGRVWGGVEVAARGWTHYGMQGKAIWDHTGLTMGCLG